MSTTIDEKVVEMRFDNSQFENNVKTSMSTLEKLKQSLNLKGASKGLEDINTAAKNVNMSGLGSAVETVQAKFSALQVVGVTALANITNSAVNAGKRLLSSLTIDQVTSGWSKYDQKTSSVQSIINATGKSIDEVNGYLDKLMWFSDETSYGFTDMTAALGQLTSAGGDIDKVVPMIEGIANATAFAGKGVNEFSRSIYNLNQSYSAGYLQYMDWKSLELAGVASKQLKETFIETAEELGKIEKGQITIANFGETLKDKWADTEVMEKAFGKFAEMTEKAYEMVQAGEVETASEAYEILSKQYEGISITAAKAAQEAKTFSEAIDATKDAVSSGWMKTFEIIFGNYEQAKILWTDLANWLWDIFASGAEDRNAMLEKAFSSTPFGELAEKIEKVTGATEAMTAATKDYSEIVDRVIGGEFGNGQSRWDALTAQGYDWAKVQNLINKQLGSSVRHTEQLEEAQEDANKTQAKTIEQLVEMSDAELEVLGFTEEEIKAFRDFEEQSKKTGIPIKDLIADMDQLNGRTLLINSFKNAGEGLTQVLNAVSDAWREAFYGDASDEDILNQKSERIYNAIAALHKFSTYLVLSEENVDKLKRTFKGLFAILNIVKTVAGGALTTGFKVLSKLLGKFDLNILDVTASIGDMLVGFQDWLFETGVIAKAFDKVIDVAAKMIQKVSEWIGAFLELPAVRNTIEDFKEACTLDNVISGIQTLIDTVKGWIDAFLDLPVITDIVNNLKESLNGASEIGTSLVDGLIEGLNNEENTLWDVLVEFAKNILAKIREVLRINSPSTETEEDGRNLVLGYANGVKDEASTLWKTLGEFASKILGFFKNIDWSSIFAGGVSIAMIAIIKKLADVLETVSSPLEGLGELFAGTGKVLSKSAGGIKKVLKSTAKVVKSFAKVLSSVAFSIKAKAIKDIAISLAILVGAIALLTFLDTDKLWDSVKIVGALAGILAGLVVVVEGLSVLSKKIGAGTFDITKIGLALIGISASLLILGITVKQIGSLNPEQAEQGFIGLGKLILAIASVVATYGILVRGTSAQSINKLGSMLMKMSIAMLLMVGVVKLVSKLDTDEMKKGATFAGAFLAFVAILSAITMIPSKNVDKLGSMLMKISISMLLMVGVVKLVGKLDGGEMKKGAIFAGAFLAFVAILSAITMIPGKNFDKLGGMLLSMSASMLIMAGIVKIISGMSVGEIVKGELAIVAFTGIIALLTGIVKMEGSSSPKIAATLLAMSISIGILAGVAILLSMIDVSGLAKGIIAVGLLGTVMAVMIKATKGVQDCMKNLIVLTVAIGVMTAAVAVLSMIDGTKLAGAVASISILMGMFALMTKAAGSVSGAMGSLIVMTVAIGLLGGLVYLLASLPVESVFGVSTSLSELLLSFAISMRIASKAGTMSASALIAVGVMTLVVAALGGILYLLRDLPVDSTLSTATSLSVLLLALSGACLILSVVGMTGAAAFIGVGALATLIAAVGGLLIAIGALADHFPKMEEFLDRGIPILEKIGYALGSFFGNIIGGFISGTSGVASQMDTFADAMVSFSDKVSGNIDEDAVTAVANAGKILAEMQSTISGSGGVVQWFKGEKDLGAFGEQLQLFADAMVSFSDKVSGNIDEEAVTAAATAGKLLAEMQSTISGTGGVVQWFSGEKNLSDFGNQIILFGEAIVGFSDTVSGGNIDEEAVTAAANAGKIMTEMQGTVSGTGGVVQWFTGEKDLALFGSQLELFGKSIVAFSDTVSGGAIDEEAVTAASTAGKIMTEMQSGLINTGGVVQWFTGEKDMAAFGNQLRLFGEAIVEFSATVGNGNIDEEAITAAAKAGMLMTEMQASINNIGGVVDFFTGSKDLDTFGAQISAFGKAIVDFSDTVSGNVDSDSISAAANAGKVMAELQKAIPKDEWFDGTVSIDKFGKDMKKFGKYVVEYSENVSGINTEAISKSITSVEKLIDLTKGMSGLDDSGIKKFKVDSIGKSISAYSKSVSGINSDAISKSISNANRLATFINSLASLNTSGVSSFKSAIDTLSGVQVGNFAETFSDASSGLSSVGGTMIDSLASGMNTRRSTMSSTASILVNDMLTAIESKASLFRTAGSNLMTYLANGIKSGASRVKTSATSSISSSITAIRKYYNDFYNAGKNLALGFANGINANSYLAAARAKAMAKAASDAAKKELDERSPSKVGYQIGDYFGVAFVNAIGDYVSKAYKASSEMAASARSGLSDAISKVKDVINGDLDTQPTIRPVLDLSEVKSGASAISSILGSGSSINAMSNIGAINSMMSRRIQNGDNSEVVSAIDRLRKDLGNIGGDTYSINGITYDDGSNVSDAIKTLVRATKIERRR